MRATRRSVFSALGAGLAVSLAGCSGSSVSGAVSTPDPNAMEQDLGDGFEKLVWQADGSAEIVLSEGHGMDGIYIAHEVDSPNDAIASCEVTRYSGSIAVPLLSLLTEEGYDYPSRRFKFIGGEGGFSGCSSIADVSNQALYGVLGTTHFTVPERFDIKG